MGIDYSIIPTLVAGALAVLFVVLEQGRGERPWHSWRLWLALVFLVATILSIVVESITTKELDKERRADLLLIQKQTAALNSLCFEIHLQPYDAKYKKGCQFQIETFSPVVARIARTGLIGEMIHFEFHPDSGWYRSSKWVTAWRTMKLEHDSINNVVRFHLTPFGIRSQSKGMLMWKADRLADLAQVRFGIQMNYSAESMEQRTSLDYMDYEPPDLSWSPVQSIYLYANSFEPENLITKLLPQVRSYSDLHNFLFFHPEDQPIQDYDNFTFHIDLLNMRNNILKNLDKVN